MPHGPTEGSSSRVVTSERLVVRVSPRVLVVLAVSVLLAAGCSSGGDDEGSATDASDAAPTLAAPAFDGAFTCTDEVGDQLDGTADAETPVSIPVPGTDLVEASAEVVGDELVVQFTTDGEVAASDEPRFVVAKGTLQQPATWFEVRAYVEEGNWVVERRRLPEQLDAIGAAQERIDVLPVPVETVGTSVRLAIPLDQLPPIDGTPTWQFGTAAAGGDVYDDCNELVG